MLREYPRRRIAVVSHQVVVLCLRYVIERLDEAGILAIDAVADVANCSHTAYRLDRATDALVLESYNEVAPLEEEGEPVTARPDDPVAAK